MLIVEPIWKYPEAIEYLKQTRGYLEIPDFVKWISDGVHSGYGTIDVSGNGHFRMLGESKVKEYCTGKGTFTMIQSPTTRYEQVIIVEGIHDAISVVHYKLAEDIIILNGAGNINKALPFCYNYKKILDCIDLDNVGHQTSKILAKACTQQNIPVYKVLHKSKDIDEAWRKQETLNIMQIKGEEEWLR